MKISTILDQIDMGSMALPEFQRGYVWNRNQVRDLMNSLYKRYPVGSLLVWETKRDKTAARGQSNVTDNVKMLLDGQQRMTSLYGIIRGKAPKFFDGDPKVFTYLYFNVEEEVFEFYGPMKMDGNPSWVDVTDLMKNGIEPFISKFSEDPEKSSSLGLYIKRLNQIHQVQEINLHVEEITGEDKDTDTVVEIFNKVNSGGTKLSKGDLALAKVCGSWPEARNELKARLERWKKAGFDFKMDWYLRCINAVVTGEAKFQNLDDITTKEFKDGLETAEKAVDKLLNTISSRLGLDHDRVLGSVYSFPLMCRYIYNNGMSLGDHRQRDQLLYWYINTMLWGRYAASTESTLDKDLDLIEDTDQPIENLVQELRQNRGDLKLYGSDFKGWSRGARFYPMLYMLTRVWHAKDWGSGDELSHHLLGNLCGLQLHHIFPKAYLYDSDYERREVNALANMTFLTQETNLEISDKPPIQYFPEIEAKHPGVLASHWIPMDENLWKKENFKDFLVARQELLAEAANKFLNELKEGHVEENEFTHDVFSEKREPLYIRVDSIADQEEEQLLSDLQSWMSGQGLPEGEWGYEILDENEEPQAIIDLAWPDGVQKYLSHPVALLIDEDEETKKIVNKAGFRYFTSAEEFRKYILEEILVLNTI
ncbi:DUF262 domain-containing protein [Rhodohalobacter mucosus]|uniref:DUF262 domain-containing protein n=1 Tax=Rhodohalobacter mucosus TaxID=2079485 RepID=A0A316TQ01_9BACT|nr:DUF262 domain-containing protein [Rhodohalobacter mucosus]PWN06470.1 hypothetical protein DDZ15_08065 [Rhodohalobacter mucosus]